jgi:hypothetical protein
MISKADVAAWHRDQHQRYQLRTDQPNPDEALRRRALRSILSSPNRLDRLIRAGGSDLIATVGASSVL